MIPYGRQEVTRDDIKEVLDVLSSDFLTQGPAVPLFEKAVADYVGCSFAVAVNSATSALHLACLALGVERGDLVWTVPISFVASANCARYCGAEVDFVDIDPITYNISIEQLRRKLLIAEEAKTLPKVLIVVHFTGMPCDMREIRELTDNHGIKVIEDASHAIGARYENAPIGKCEYSDATVFSFHPVKIITTGEGGILLTNDQALYAKAETLRSHGITKDPANFEFHDQGPWWYEQKELGYNYRMTDIQAALGISQMERLEKYIERRNSLARRYDENLAELEIQLPWNNPSRKSSYHLYTIRLSARKHKRSRAEIYDLLREFGVGTQVHYIPIHIQPYYRKLGFRPEQFPESMAFYNEAITIPLFGSMSLDQQDKVVLALKEALS